MKTTEQRLNELEQRLNALEGKPNQPIPLPYADDLELLLELLDSVKEQQGWTVEVDPVQLNGIVQNLFDGDSRKCRDFLTYAVRKLTEARKAPPSLTYFFASKLRSAWETHQAKAKIAPIVVKMPIPTATAALGWDGVWR